MRDGKSIGSEEISSGLVFREACEAQISFSVNGKVGTVQRLDDEFDVLMALG